MLTKGVVEDLIMLHLSRLCPGGGATAVKKVPELAKKVFLSDWEMRRIYRPGSRTVQVPVNAILSPLSLDLLDYNGIKITRG